MSRYTANSDYDFQEAMGDPVPRQERSQPRPQSGQYISKGPLRVEQKRDARLSKAEQERICRIAVQKRDKGKCVVPGCKEAGPHKHHITYRSKGGKWRSENVCSLCPGHHAMVHAGRIQITGNADEHLTITGDKKDLAFRL